MGVVGQEDEGKMTAETARRPLLFSQGPCSSSPCEMPRYRPGSFRAHPRALQLTSTNTVKQYWDQGTALPSTSCLVTCACQYGLNADSCTTHRRVTSDPVLNNGGQKVTAVRRRASLRLER
ncbi:hypothetical protein SKAU_G00262090 [Synaphobranchus kaupii]|uniref:Uncharacterized protein n=1 Tax=Synaphobranchus kaupii TaxID=118154 RepID=A0A9Q1EYK7_SYNKA|nr:hypothetical protein SKAU_G00262090 [Synaphobranchus kaupii]